jgi:ribosomal protection tetracycline resistance protein
MTQYLSRALGEGLYGWRVTDCVVTLDNCGYYIGDGPKKPTALTLRTAASDFRKLTPMVAMAALERTGTVVCEPILKVHVEVPSDMLTAVLAIVARLGGVVDTPSVRGRLSVVETELPSAVVQDLTRQLPGLSGGEGVIETDFYGYRPVSGVPPTRPRTMANPLNRIEYLMELRGRAFRSAN